MIHPNFPQKDFMILPKKVLFYGEIFLLKSLSRFCDTTRCQSFLSGLRKKEPRLCENSKCLNKLMRLHTLLTVFASRFYRCHKIHLLVKRKVKTLIGLRACAG